MRKNLFLGCLAIIIITLLYHLVSSDGYKLSRIEYRTDLNPIQKRFPALKDIKEVYWKSGAFGRGGIGPTDIWLKGFIILDEEIGNNFLNDYLWKSFDLKFENGMSPDITGFNTFNWLYSTEFTEKIKSIEYMGDIYFDKQNKVIYFDLNTF